MASSTALPLSGKVIIVTGASSGIGSAIATAVAEAGASIVLAARRLERLEQEKTSLESKIASCTPIPPSLQPMVPFLTHFDVMCFRKTVQPSYLAKF